MAEMVKFKNFEEEYDSRVIIRTFENIMDAIKEGEFARVNSLVKFLDSSMIYLMSSSSADIETKKLMKRIEEYRMKDDNLANLKVETDRDRQILRSFGVGNVDVYYILWHKLYSKWLRDIVFVLSKTNKLGRRSIDFVYND